MITETKCIINVMCSNHPETIPTLPTSQVRGKIISQETGPWCQKRLGTAVLGVHVSSTEPPLWLIRAPPLWPSK